jgi:hypothetical protein
MKEREKEKVALMHKIQQAEKTEMEKKKLTQEQLSIENISIR